MIASTAGSPISTPRRDERGSRFPRRRPGYHVLNRGNARQQVFFKDGDYQAFLKAMAHACVEVPMRVVGWCLMPNHFHLVLWPHRDGELSDWMQWLCNAHVRRYHRHYRSSGHIWQGRFKAFPIEQDEHLLTALRYVERNALRAALVERAELWPWSSLHCWQGRPRPSFWHDGPVPRPAEWIDLVNEPMTEAELSSLRSSVNRPTVWQRSLAAHDSGSVRFGSNLAATRAAEEG